MREKKVISCSVKTCTNKSDQGKFVKEFCFPCWDAITNPGPHARNSAIYRQMLVAIIGELG